MRFLEDLWTIALREFLRYRRDRAYVAGQLLVPILMVGFIGFGLNPVVRIPGGGTNYLGWLSTGFLVLMLSSGAIGGGFMLIQDREAGFLRAILVAPVSRASIVLGKILSRIAASVLLIAVLIAIFLAFTPIRLVHPLVSLVALAGLSFSFVSFGILLATRLRALESYRLIAGLVTVPLYLTSGIFFPVKTMPAAMRAVAHANPVTYGVDLFRYGLTGVHELPLALDTAIVVALGALLTLLAVRAFDRKLRD